MFAIISVYSNRTHVPLKVMRLYNALLSLLFNSAGTISHLTYQVVGKLSRDLTSVPERIEGPDSHGSD